ncbi:carbohydrate ABC transporter substrate-binding protein [Labrys okinawensis]|uniref:carbohydrate ABC transporter substrate-binding protein n=1 Tax=Labrys okinawensis TaxID=346911 RepID=UPI0039BD09B7
MSKARYLGLTWDHPRGYNALAAAAREIAPPDLLHWEKQPLEGFESHPIADLAGRYDLLVLDHPHIGEAVAQDCLLPLDELFGPEELAHWERATMGSTMASYHWQGRQWAIPLDIATQVCAYRVADIGVPPNDWQGMVALSRRMPVALSVAGPHAVLNLFSMIVSLGRETGGEDLVDEETGRAALALLAELHHRTPEFSRRLNPIGLLEAMARGEGIACVPLVYGYVNYAIGAPGRQALRFTEAPAGKSKRRGSVLGGTGVALTRRSRPDDELLAHLRWLMGIGAQCGFIPDHDGQPSLREAWQAAPVNAQWGGFYRATAATTESAWVRPRFDGYIAFQTDAAALIRAALEARQPESTTLSQLRERWRQARLASRGPLM